jgi:SUMO ligase MMS21 Smc5/6 complex component
MENNISDTLDTLMMLILYPSIETNNIQDNNTQDNNTQDNNTQSLTDDDTIYNQLLNSSLYDKFTYKYVLSEEGESQLKTIKFTKELGEINNSCPITSLEFEENQNIISLPCNHYFDPDAINKWLKEEKAECPVCRFKLHSKEVKIDEKNYIREDVNSLINLYHSRINLINSLARVSYAYNPFSDNYFNMLVREREIYEDYNDFIQNMTYTIYRQI